MPPFFIALILMGFEVAWVNYEDRDLVPCPANEECGQDEAPPLKPIDKFNKGTLTFMHLEF